MSTVNGPRAMRRTEHPGGLQVISVGDDEVLLRFRGEQSHVVEMDVLRAIVAEHGQTPRGSDWLSPEEQAALEQGIRPHPFTNSDGYFSAACTAMVERGDSGEDCGLPASSHVHDDPREGQDFDWEGQE